MSKVGQWVLGMQEDAAWMSRDVFVRVHGISNVDVYDDFHNEDNFYEPEIPEEIFEAN